MDKGNKDKLNALHKLLDKELSFLQGHSSTELESRDNSYLSVQKLDESGYASSNFRATQPEDRFTLSRNEENQRDSMIGKDRFTNGFSSSKGNYFTASNYNNSFQSQQQQINNNFNSQSLHSSFKGNSGPTQLIEEKPYQNTSRFSSGKTFLSPEQGHSQQILKNSQIQEKYAVPSKEFISYDQTKLEDQNPLSNENIQREINGIQTKIQFLEQKIKSHEGKQDFTSQKDHQQDTIFDNALDTFSALPSGQKPPHQPQSEKIDSTLYPEDLRGYSSLKARSFNGAISVTDKTLKQQDFQGSLGLQETLEKRKIVQKNEQQQQLIDISRSKEKRENNDKSIKEKKKLDSSVNYLERDIKTAEHNLDLSKRSLKSSLKTPAGSKANTSHRWQSQTPPGSSGKKRASSQRGGQRERSNSQNHQYATAPKPFFPIDSYASDYNENVELRQKIFALKKSHEIERQKLQEERERNKEIMEEIERMEIKIKKIQIQVDKTAQGEEDYQRLLETSSKSESIRKQQKTLIEQLREDVEECKLNQEINGKQKNLKRQQANSSQRNQKK